MIRRKQKLTRGLVAYIAPGSQWGTRTIRGNTSLAVFGDRNVPNANRKTVDPTATLVNLTAADVNYNSGRLGLELDSANAQNEYFHMNWQPEGMHKLTWVMYYYRKSTGNNRIYSASNQNSNNQVIQFGWNNDDNVYCGVGATLTNQSNYASFADSRNDEWVVHAFTYDGSVATNDDRVQVFADGVIQSKSITGPGSFDTFVNLTNVTDVVWFGWRMNLGDTFRGDGYFGAVGIWNRVLSREELRLMAYDPFAPLKELHPQRYDEPPPSSPVNTAAAASYQYRRRRCLA